MRGGGVQTAIPRTLIQKFQHFYPKSQPRINVFKKKKIPLYHLEVQHIFRLVGPELKITRKSI